MFHHKGGGGVDGAANVGKVQKNRFQVKQNYDWEKKVSAAAGREIGTYTLVDVSALGQRCKSREQ